MPLYIVKPDGIEKFIFERAVGTMVTSGVEVSLAIDTVTTAVNLFREPEVTHVPVDKWVIISEELRRGNVATATRMIWL